MRRPHHPYWLEKLAERWNLLISRQFVCPHFDGLGVDPRFTGCAYIDVRGRNIRAGDHFHVYATREQPVSLAVDPFGAGEGQLNFGNYVILAPGVRIRSAQAIDIGNNAMIAERVLITDADWHDHYHRIYPGKRAPVVIEDNVWICDGATICKGVTIGENSIIGASAVVTRDIPKNSIAAGNPAKVVAELDPNEPITRRDALFVGGLPYQDFKNQFDRARLTGNTLLGLLRSKLKPDQDT